MIPSLKVAPILTLKVDEFAIDIRRTPGRVEVAVKRADGNRIVGSGSAGSSPRLGERVPELPLALMAHHQAPGMTVPLDLMYERELELKERVRHAVRQYPGWDGYSRYGPRKTRAQWDQDWV